uniref:Right handed beta helix domain-containing protein n=1 Tax=Chrysotila carterae TaxID=13221 RepID=A0A7S4EYR1_CHRCT
MVTLSPSLPPSPPCSLVPHLHSTSIALTLVRTDLFMVMCTCRAWRDAARVQYAARTIFVPAEPDALLRAVRAAAPGETIRLLPGVHMLSDELTVDRPLRLLGPGADDADAGSVHAAGCASDASHANCSCGAECVTGVSDVSGGGGGGDGCGVVCARDAVLCSPKHVVIRTRSSTCLSRLTLCRLGDDVGYPNTVVFAEASRLFLDGCRITCGGGATSVAEALHAFDGFAHPAHALDACACPAAQQGGCRPPVDSQRLDRPQAGVWVGAAASVFMTRNLISCTMGPGIKVYRGTLEAEGNTVAYSCRGANVVANGGKVRLVRNVIRSAFGDGISSWNDAEMRVEANHIHSNTGSGVAINSVGGEVRITDNYVFDNAKSAVLFVTSQAQQAVLSGNMMLEQNGGGGVQGLRQHHKARGRMLTPMHCAPVAPRRDVFDASLSMET